MDACRSETDSQPLNGLFPGYGRSESTLSLVHITQNTNRQDRPIPYLREIPFGGWLLLRIPSAGGPIRSESVEPMRKISTGLTGVGGIEFGRSR